jgi:hypothetical protein
MSKQALRKALVLAALTTTFALPVFADPVAPEPIPHVKTGTTTTQSGIVDTILTLLGMS